MCAIQRVVLIVDREACWLPPRNRCMAVGTGIGNTYGNVVRVYRLVKCIGMAITAQSRSAGVSGAVTPVATGIHMCTC